MSRIEKGTQRFRPTVISRRATGGDGAHSPLSTVPVVPKRPAADQGAPDLGARNLPASAASSAWSYARGAPTRSSVPRVRHTLIHLQQTIISPGQRSTYVAASRQSLVRPRTTSLVPSSTANAFPNAAMSVRIPSHAYQQFLAAAQGDPSLVHLDTAAESADIAVHAASVWRGMHDAERMAYAATPSHLKRPRPQPKRRFATSISDDEAEYNAQCAAHADAVVQQGDLPPLRVDIGTTTMESIAVNNWKSGRASSRTFELERVRARQLKKRRLDGEAAKVEGKDAQIKESGTPAPLEDEAHDAPPDPESAFQENRFAVQTRIVDGKIVLDEQSLYANYRDEEQQERELRTWEVVDEREGDQFVNSASRSKQRRTQRWSAEETERFFLAVSQWGTDFEMITRLFPHRTRREIKSKWTKESRQNAKRLDDAFVRRIAVDLTAYGNAAGVDLSGPPPVITPKAPDTPSKPDAATDKTGAAAVHS